MLSIMKNQAQNTSTLLDVLPSFKNWYSTHGDCDYYCFSLNCSSKRLSGVGKTGAQNPEIDLKLLSLFFKSTPGTPDHAEWQQYFLMTGKGQKSVLIF